MDRTNKSIRQICLIKERLYRNIEDIRREGKKSALTSQLKRLTIDMRLSGSREDGNQVKEYHCICPKSFQNMMLFNEEYL